MNANVCVLRLRTGALLCSDFVGLLLVSGRDGVHAASFDEGTLVSCSVWIFCVWLVVLAVAHNFSLAFVPMFQPCRSFVFLCSLFCRWRALLG